MVDTQALPPKEARGRGEKEREASEPTFTAIPPKEGKATKIQAAANRAPATGIRTKYYAAGKRRYRKPYRWYDEKFALRPQTKKLSH